MLKVRVIPTLLFKDIGLVKGKQFDSDRRVGLTLPAIKVYNMREVDELILVDVMASNDNREPDYEAIEEFTEESFVPFTVGGGVSSVEHIRKLLRVGADKVSINTAAINNPSLINEASSIFGSQCIVISIDSKKSSDGEYYCYTNSGSIKTSVKVIDWVKEVEKRGAGELLVTSIDHDGMMSGYDLELIKLVADHASIPVIASGGAGELDDFYKVVSQSHASAVAAASIFHFRETTPQQVKDYLFMKGIPTRNSSI